ncbi:MAG: hypothetical protein UW75_C0042G0003 [Parcubacteria group bacterium GW2011_GWF2_44_8]|nr:MAG: hypothetical protein UW75_C0042G0003 [Parcubacteria group bacterium GW2011_GWF2_44_8]
MVASNILHQAALELVKMVLTVNRKLEFTQGFDLVLVGSVVQQPEIKDEVAHRLAEANVGANVTIPTQPPVFGAVKMALRSLKS